MNPLIEHAARVLDHQPTRSMDAEQLYRRVIREADVNLPFGGFMAAVRERSHRFAVISADPGIGAASAWDARHRSLYQAALEAAGLLRPVVVLTERPKHREQNTEDSIRPPTPADVIADAQDALVHLLHVSDPDDPLRAAVTNAMDELHAVRRALHE